MDKIIITLLCFTSIAATARAQRNGAAVAGSREAFNAIYGAQQRQAAELEDWRSSKKLMVVDAAPVTPRDQFECMSPAELRNNSRGYLDYWQFTVLQVVGPKDLILTMRNPKIPPLWLSGYPTADLVDGDKIRLVGPVAISGTKTYPTPLGSKTTVRMAQFLPRDEIEEFEKDLAARRAAAIAEADELNRKAELEALSRTWSDKQGHHSVKAVFIDFRFEGGIVKLKRVDNEKIIEVPISRLSKSDQVWVRAEVKRRAQTK